MAVTTFQTVKSFAQFLLNWTLKGGHFVDQNTANLRAILCTTCHNNKSSSEVKGGCRVCNKGGNYAVELIRKTVIRDKKTAFDSSLKVCGLCGCDLRMKVWMPLDALGQTKEEANAWPSFCWRKAILEGKELL